jgi:hypothetical protein
VALAKEEIHAATTNPVHFQHVMWKRTSEWLLPSLYVAAPQHHNAESKFHTKVKPEFVVPLHQRNHRSFPHLVATSSMTMKIASTIGGRGGV